MDKKNTCYPHSILRRAHKRLIFVTAILTTILVILGSVYFFFNEKHNDEVLQSVFEKVGEVDFYTQEVRTETSLSERTITVEGVYQNDYKNSLYSAVSTTSVRFPDVSFPVQFTLYNISSIPNVYTKAESANPELITTIPVQGGWRSFNSREIPEEYKSIAIPGPVLDNLQILSKNGSYVELIETHGKDATFGDELLRFSFRVKPSLKERPGPLAAIYERLRETGTVDIWVSEDSKSVRHMVFNNPPYFSTTTIKNINTPQIIDIPTL